MLIADKSKCVRERVAVRWTCVIGALITWSALFVSWHRWFVFGWTDRDRHVNWWWVWSDCWEERDGILERLTAQFSMIKYPCQRGVATTDRRGSDIFADLRGKRSWNATTLHVGSVLTLRTDVVGVAAFVVSNTARSVGPVIPLRAARYRRCQRSVI
jgi:hypothetical protein